MLLGYGGLSFGGLGFRVQGLKPTGSPYAPPAPPLSNLEPRGPETPKVTKPESFCHVCASLSQRSRGLWETPKHPDSIPEALWLPLVKALVLLFLTFYLSLSLSFSLFVPALSLSLSLSLFDSFCFPPSLPLPFLLFACFGLDIAVIEVSGSG